MTWAVPKQDAVTLGELGGELYSVSPRDEAHVGDEFIRRGGSVFPPARVTCAAPRRPFGQQESLTQELDEDGALDSGALRLLKQASRATKSFLLDDELQVLQTALEAAKRAAHQLVAAATGRAESDDEEDEDGVDGDQAAVDPALQLQGESIVDVSWHPTLSLLAVAQQDGVVSLYDVASATWETRVMEHPAQTDITSIQWGRFTGGVIAVACRIVGGKVQSIAWDPSGSRVAVSYRSTVSGSRQGVTGQLVAIFSVAWEPFLIFTRRFVCRSGCGDLGDPELDYLCVDCHADRLERRQQQELRKHLAPGSAVTTATASEPELSSLPPSSPKKNRGPRPVNHAKALEDFLRQPREQDANVITREVLFLKREMEMRETSKNQLRKYMIATDGDGPVDPKEWGRYQYGAPKSVPTRDVDEATESAAQLTLFCYWRKRQVEQRIESKRLQLETERQVLKHKKSGVSTRSLSLVSFRGSLKTAVDHVALAVAVNNLQPAARKKHGATLFDAWRSKTSQ
ncbi:hypothetical protein BBJ28_00014042 [Nothophytophthora sp. Chile5]|nr:hypothetical protein BBJ28_00014042 [Nothophytophthora sp. Chile5]